MHSQHYCSTRNNPCWSRKNISIHSILGMKLTVFLMMYHIPLFFFFFLKLVMVNAWSSNMVYCIGDRNVDLWSLKLILIQRHIRPTWQNNSHLLECFHGHILCSAKSAKSCPLGLEIGKIENRLSGKALLSRGHLARTSGSGGKRGLWIFGDGSFTSAVSGERRRLSKEVILFPSVTQAAYTWANLD